MYNNLPIEQKQKKKKKNGIFDYVVLVISLHITMRPPGFKFDLIIKIQHYYNIF
jgi:hypothetical protein